MTEPGPDFQLKKTFGRRKRSLLSFRRVGDLAWFLLVLSFFIFALTTLIFDVPLR